MDFITGRPIQNLEAAVNNLVDAGYSFGEIQNFVNECLTRVVWTRKTRRDIAWKERQMGEA
jgi:hypothetical protein